MLKQHFPKNSFDIVQIADKDVEYMLESIVSVHKWTEEFHQRLREEYGRLSHNVENMIVQLQEMIEAFHQACMVVVTETDGKIIEVNDAFCDVSGYSREELIGSHHNILKSGHPSSTFYEEVWEKLQNGTTWAGELKHKRKDGTYYWVKASFFRFPVKTACRKSSFLFVLISQL